MKTEKLRINVNSLVRYKYRCQNSTAPMRVRAIKVVNNRQYARIDNGWIPADSLLTEKEWQKLIKELQNA